MNAQTAEILNNAWNAGNCCLIGTQDTAQALAINTPSVTGLSMPGASGSLVLPAPANTNTPSIQVG